VEMRSGAVGAVPHYLIFAGGGVFHQVAEQDAQPRRQFVRLPSKPDARILDHAVGRWHVPLVTVGAGEDWPWRGVSGGEFGGRAGCRRHGLLMFVRRTTLCLLSPRPLHFHHFDYPVIASLGLFPPDQGDRGRPPERFVEMNIAGGQGRNILTFLPGRDYPPAE